MPHTRIAVNTYHNLIRSSNLSDLACTELTILDVGGSTRAHAGHLSGSVYGNEDEVGLQNSLVDVG